MFWTNWNEQSPSIMRASLSGANVLVIIGNDIRTPNGLAIDHRAEKLYFSDATLDKIERCEYDGSHRYVSDPGHALRTLLKSHFSVVFCASWVVSYRTCLLAPPAGGVEERAGAPLRPGRLR